jgi:LysM repeat protein
MKWKGTEEAPAFRKGSVVDDFDEDEYPVWEKQKKSSVSETLLKKIEIPYILMAVGLVIVLVVFFISMSKEDEVEDVSRIDALEQRLGAIEDRLFKLEGINPRAETIGEQNKTLDSLILKVSQLEADVTARMDQLSSDLSKLGRKVTTVERATPVSAKKDTSAKETPAKAVYHQVRRGETLYGIGRQYDVSIEDLRKFNNLTRGESIYPGQRLIVGTAKTP